MASAINTTVPAASSALSSAQIRALALAAKTEIEALQAIKAFGTIAVAGQTNLVADADADTLTLVAGTNISITINEAGDSITINSSAGSGGAARTYGAVETVGRTLIAADLNVTILYNSASAGVFTIPSDAALGITGSTEAVFKVVQLGAGAVSIVGASGVTNNKPTDIPPAIQYSTEVATRYGASTYLGTRV